MRTCIDCIPCFVRQALDAARNVTSDVSTHERVMRAVLRMAAELDLNRPPPYMGQAIHRELRELTGVLDPYRAAKNRFSRLAVALLPELSVSVREAPDPLLVATKYAIAANSIDLAVSASLTEAEARAALLRAPSQPIHADWEDFRDRLAAASDILFLADNAGEIAIDRLLIEQIGPERVTVAVRGRPVLNDATLEDAREVGLHDLVEVIDNGSDAPGTLLDDCGAPFRDRFRRAGLIIAKGQGNFEGLSGIEAPLYFLLKIKCPVVSLHVGLPVGTHAVLRADHQPAPERGRQEEWT